MNATQAQACVSAIIAAGFDADAHLNADASWTVRATSSAAAFTIDSTQIAALVTEQGVAGKVAIVEFS